MSHLKKILLVAPMNKKSVFKTMAVLKVPQLSLAILKKLTPKEYIVDTVDESIYRGDICTDYDLVGISVMTATANRAYELATKFRSAGVKVVLGGIHVSMCPEEAKNFADAIFIGEAENGGWVELLKDFEQGKLKKEYVGGKAKAENIPMVKNKGGSILIGGSVQTARGCPIGCRFCSVSIYNGRAYRGRPITLVLEELRQYKNRPVVILDDNIVGHGKESELRALELFRAMSKEKLGIKWGSQASINMADNPKLLDAASKAGATLLFIGLESLDSKVLGGMGKKVNVDSLVQGYERKIKEFHKRGISLIGGFILGNIGDGPEVFERTKEFVLSSGLDGAQYSLATPLPGTPFWGEIAEKKSLLKDNFPHDWDYFDCGHAVIRLENFTSQEIEREFVRLYKATHSMSNTVEGMIKTTFKTKNLFSAVVQGYSKQAYLKGINSMRLGGMN